MTSTTAVWTRGMGVLLTATDPNGQSTEVRNNKNGALGGRGAPAAFGRRRRESFLGGGPLPTQTFRYLLLTGPPNPFDAVGIPSSVSVRAQYEAVGQMTSNIEHPGQGAGACVALRARAGETRGGQACHRGT